MRKTILIPVLVLSAIGCTPVGTDPARADDRELGRYLANQCVGCHKRSGKSAAIPPLSAWNTDSFVAIMMAYKRIEKAGTIMQAIAKSLSDKEISALATYVGSREPDR